MVCHEKTWPPLATYGQAVIDHEGPVPLYRQLADILREQIVSGELAPQRPIPSITQLRQEYRLARGTVVHALQVLVEEGFIHSVSGRGMFVLPADQRRDTRP